MSQTFYQQKHGPLKKTQPKARTTAEKQRRRTQATQPGTGLSLCLHSGKTTMEANEHQNLLVLQSSLKGLAQGFVPIGESSPWGSQYETMPPKVYKSI